MTVTASVPTDPIPLGNAAELTGEFFNRLNGPADPTVVTLILIPPRGARETPVVLRKSLGVWGYEFIASIPGRWEFRWVGTGAVAAATKRLSFWVSE